MMRPLTVPGLAIGATALALFACTHAKTTDAQRPGEPAAEHATVKAAPDSGRTASAGGKLNATPVAALPEGLLKPGAAQKIRDKLSEGGLIRDGKTSTEAALRRFQGSHDLPTTGIPDHETIRKLGLNPDDVFRKAAP